MVSRSKPPVMALGDQTCGNLVLAALASDVGEFVAPCITTPPAPITEEATKRNDKREDGEWNLRIQYKHSLPCLRMLVGSTGP